MTQWTQDKVRLVPVEPTDEMMEAAEQYLVDEGWESDSVGELSKLQLWDAMLAAVPVITSEEGADYDEDAAKRLRAILSMLGIGAPESDEQMMLCQFSLFGMMRHKIKQLYTAPQHAPDVEKRIAELEADKQRLLDVLKELVVDDAPLYGDGGNDWVKVFDRAKSIYFNMVGGAL